MHDAELVLEGEVEDRYRKQREAVWLLFGILTGMAAYAVLSAKKSPSGPRRRNATLASKPLALPGPESPHGLLLEGDSLRIESYDRWMRFSTHAIRRAVSEGAQTPEHVVARMFYLAFPERSWPPPSDSPLAKTYAALVETTRQNLDQELRPIRVTHAQRRGLSIV